MSNDRHLPDLFSRCRRQDLRIYGREDFGAVDDTVATAIGRRLFDACSDACANLSIREGTRRLPHVDGINFPSVAEISRKETEKLRARLDSADEPERD